MIKGDIYMKEEKQRDLLGIISIALGGIFIIAGIALFFMSNYMNFQLHKTEATVIGMYDITLEDGLKHTMVELSYHVGNELVLTNYEYPGTLSEETMFLEVYYNIKEPGMVVDAGWSFGPVLVFALGLLILIPGLYMKGVLKADWLTGDPKYIKSGKMTRELYDARSRAIEGILPMLAGILFVVFGIVMMIKDTSWWTWIFVVVGIIELLYVGMDFVPALITWISLSRVNALNAKVKVYDVEISKEKEAEDKKPDAKDKSDKEEAKDEVKTEEEELEPFEIKTVNTNKSKGKLKNKAKSKLKHK